ncbi:hypothetical protein M427DRAFT_433037 [Gonapodya prolifera JEL478]|uniref:Uncharacterized protein n=1 Tax=Gonapodya prolifera (strain JEL478) TaxID=1344416 RepID=A0A139AT49_GONPJ|nr:hypothetical protein M427DRAFT_433037 [Gonapodya prolifera JEL478]|eukprot:KXS19910.1 hypothetical protein M427DRAFT_433037 [Gonapodya prolifera JEL478]
MDRVDASHMVFGNAMEAEEDAQLLFSSAIFPLWDYTTTTHRYVRGHPGADPRRWRWYFVLLKAYYQMWQSGWEDGEVGGWVLKSPCYTRPITTLLSVFHNPTPHTRLASLADPPTTPVSALWLRRHPSRTVPSSARLFETLVGIALPPTGASELADRRKVGLYAARYVGDQWRPLPGEDDPKGEIHAAFLSRVVEVRYGPFVADPVRWLQDAIRARPDVLGTAPGGCGLEWTPEWEERFRAYEEENDERRKKVKEAGMGGQWSAADLGLSEREMIEATGVGWDEVDELME